MASVNDAKRRIIEDLEKIRGDLSGASVELRGQLNFQRRFSVVWQKQRWIWLTFVALFGWVLSRLPRRTKKIYIEKGKGGARVPPPGKGFAGTFAGQLWSVAWSVAKPALVAYLTKRMAKRA